MGVEGDSNLPSPSPTGSLFFGISLDSEFPWNSPLLVPQPGSAEKLSITHKRSYKSRPPESMDSLVSLCTHRVIDNRPLPVLPPHLYHAVFQAAFLAGRALVLQDLVATWPFPELHFQRLVGNLELPGDHPYKDCIKAVIQAVVEQLRQELEEPGRQSSRFRLRVLDMTGVPDDPEERWFYSSTKALATACVELSKHQQEFQRHKPERHIRCSGATAAVAALQPPSVDVLIDLHVSEKCYEILYDALQTRAAGPLRLTFREFHSDNISASKIVTLLESLDPSCLRRVGLFSIFIGFPNLLEILPHLSRFPELRSLKLRDIDNCVQIQTPESASGIRDVGRQLGLLSSLLELNLTGTQLSGNLSQILCDLQTPLESLDLSYCSLVPADLVFLSQSIHPPALKRLDLSGNYISQGLLEPLRLLLEETSVSLLHLDLTDCHVADSHLAALLPTLLRCSHLRFLGLYHNPLSKAAIKDLLQKTLELLHLHLVMYPIPLDCHTDDPSEFDCGHFHESLDENLLSAAEVEISQLLADSGRADLIWTDNPDSHEAPDYFSL
ncbi:leucine-rich repeat-containing protein 14-like [Oenanthe melanoleuca]|uniref:leucine-rich repeat-containing protein 14-like n=1 Tax=Oenanthe melanoleuca TaxID=2939378 RepID=UPI0024C14BCD|nr:leucine-rich repeat-containing protein 14-like [Oenanthe melanoleuca]